jgi:chitinase
MRSSGYPVRLLVVVAGGLFGSSIANGGADIWRTGYYPGYHQGTMPASNIDFVTITHVIHFSLVPRTDGTLDSNLNVITPAYSQDLVTRAHAGGRKALICIGGAGSQAAFQGATATVRRGGFITNIVNFVKANGYDGVDLDWEPLEASDAGQFTNLVKGLGLALKAWNGASLLTVATATEPALFSQLQSQFDQINLMTYDLAGPWPGWVTWFNSPIFDGGYRFPSTGALVPSSEAMVNSFAAAGVPLNKLGLGIPFFGFVWSGGSGTTNGGVVWPRQQWVTAPSAGQLAYTDILTSYYQSNRYHWDEAAQAAYLSLDLGGAANDRFISYDDEHACQAKVSYARNRSLGGIMIWELAQDYRSDFPAGQRNPLALAIRHALTTPQMTSIAASNGNVHLQFSSSPLGLYRVTSTSNLASPAWMTVGPNVSAMSAFTTVKDNGGVTNGQAKFYRVQTPP